MSTVLNLTIIITLLGAVIAVIGWRFIKGSKRPSGSNDIDKEHFTLQAVDDFVRDRVTELSTLNLYNLGLSKEEFERQTRRQQELKEALRNCNTGDFGAKTYIRELILEILMNEYGFNEQNIDMVIPYDTPNQLTVRVKFDILLYLQRKKFGTAGLEKLIEKYSLADLKDDESYRVDENDISSIYKEEVRNLSFDDKLRVIVQRVYSGFRGFGVIDDIRDMTIDGVSGGVSGIPPRIENFDDDEKMISSFDSAKSSLNSVWVMYKGKSIHFSFLQFTNEAELRRVVHNLYKYKYPGQLSESRPYIINEMYDGSRVTVVRPTFTESWAFFVRKKYDMSKLEMEQLITHPNASLPIRLMKYLMKGNRHTSVSGEQGSGKTTLTMAMIAFIRKTLNLRVQETSFELNLRSLYPDRNILTFQETDTISGQEGLDLQKKTDGSVNIVGEVATDSVAAWMIQSAQVASLFSLFTHHANTFDLLVDSLRNSLLKVGMFQNESIAEQQVVSVLEFNIHMEKKFDGTRYISRITECIPVELESNFLPFDKNLTKEDKLDAFYTAATVYFRQHTRKRQFESRNIVEFIDGKYVAGHQISQKRLSAIEKNLSTDEQKEFRAFVHEVWGDAE